MAANIAPIFSRLANNGWDKLLTGNTTRDLTSGTVYLLMTAAADGARLSKITLQPLGTNVATVARIFLNNGGVTTTAANNVMIREVLMPATTSSEAAVLAQNEQLFDLPIKGGYRIYAVIGTTVAAGIAASAHGGDY